MAQSRRGIYTEMIRSTRVLIMPTPSAMKRKQKQPCPVYGGLSALLASLIAVVMLLTACAGAPAPAVSEKSAAVVNSIQSSRSSNGGSGTPVRPVIPAPPQVILGTAPRLGSAAARIGIVEFSDYQCPYCRSFHEQIFPKLRKEYVNTGIVQFIHKDLPLRRIHPQAMPAAMAANCAGMQNRFWEMHEALYANQGRLAPALYPELARALKLDEAKFSACLKGSAHAQQILRDTTEAQRLGVNGTPSFVIGKIEGNTLTMVRMAAGAPGFEAFAQEIERLRHQINTDATPETK